MLFRTRESCEPVSREVCEPDCRVVLRQIGDRQCTKVPETICENEEKAVPREVCRPIQRQECTPISKKECEMQPVEKCKEVNLYSADSEVFNPYNNFLSIFFFFKVPITACERVPTEKCKKVKRVVCQDKLSESNRNSSKGRDLTKCSLKSCQKCSYQCSVCKPLGDIRAFGQRFF